MRYNSIDVKFYDFNYIKFINDGWDCEQSFLLVFDNGNITYTKYIDVDEVISYSRSEVIRYAAVNIT